MIRRNFLFRTFTLLAVLSVAACVTPIGKTIDTRDFKVDRVAVDLSEFKGIKGGREISVSREKVKKDLSDALTAILRAETADHTRAVNVSVKITGVSLVSPGQALLIGGISTIRGFLTATDAKTGEVLIPPTEVIGTPRGYAPGGVIGSLITKSPEKDYEATVQAFALDVRSSLFPATN